MFPVLRGRRQQLQIALLMLLVLGVFLAAPPLLNWIFEYDRAPSSNYFTTDADGNGGQIYTFVGPQLDDASIIDWLGTHIPPDGRNTIIFQNTQATDMVLDALKALPGTVRLDVSETRITEDGYQELKECLPNCEIVR